MKYIFTDFVDGIHCIRLTDKGWNYIATILLVLSGSYWLSLCDNGVFFQLTGCVSYLFATGVWATKTGWAKKFWEMMEDGRKYNE